MHTYIPKRGSQAIISHRFGRLPYAQTWHVLMLFRWGSLEERKWSTRLGLEPLLQVFWSPWRQSIKTVWKHCFPRARFAIWLVSTKCRMFLSCWLHALDAWYYCVDRAQSNLDDERVCDFVCFDYCAFALLWKVAQYRVKASRLTGFCACSVQLLNYIGPTWRGACLVSMQLDRVGLKAGWFRLPNDMFI
jgi:hypothetical protein